MPRKFHPSITHRVICTVPSIALAAMLVMGGLSESGLLLVACLLGAAAAVAVTWRSWLLRVELGDGEVVVVNWTRTLHIPWSEIERFGYDGGVLIRRRDMREHRVAAFEWVPGALPFTHRPAERAAAELEAARKRRRRHGGGRDRPKPRRAEAT